MEKKRDLGFFNGVKTEVIPLIAGLVSFTILAEDAVNQIESIFDAEGNTGIIVFILIYFAVPVVFIVCWLVFVNYHDGLKAHFIRKRKAPIVWLVLAILLLVMGLLPAVWLSTVQQFVYLALVVVILVLIYVVWLLFLRGLCVPSQREYRQAKWQFGLTGVLLMSIWLPYFKAYTKKKDFATQWGNESNLKAAIDSASEKRKTYKIQFKAAESFLDHLPDYFFAPKDSTAGSLNKKIALDSLNKYYREIWNTNYYPTVNFIGPDKRFNIDSIRYIVYRKQVANLKEYQDKWAPWLMIIQFKGLLIFSLLSLLLMAIWYHSYHLQLDGRSSEEFSEIAISKLSVYILFLLIIPFFKPIEKAKISFGKPYITFENPITVNNKVFVDLPKPPPPLVIEYAKIVYKADSVVKKRIDSLAKHNLKPMGEAMGKIRAELGDVKKRAKKTKSQ